MSRLCLVCVSLRSGGTERVVSRLANYLTECHDVTVLLLSRSKPFYKLNQEVKLIQPEYAQRSKVGWRWYPYTISYLRREISQACPDLILCFGEPIAPLVLPLAALLGYRTLIFNRASPLTSLKGCRGWLNPLTYPLAHRVIVQTERSVEIMKHRYRLSKFVVLPNPVHIPSHVLPIAHRRFSIINVGTLGGNKNQQALIRSFADIKYKKGWTLNIVGDGPDRGVFENLATELGVRDSVKFHGQRRDVDFLLQEARIFAFTSLTEGFPNALAEALAAGCACISYDCPTGPSELIDDGVNGLLVPNNDQNAFRKSLEKLMTNSELQASLASAARADLQRFRTEFVLDRVEHIIQESLQTENISKSNKCDS